MSIPGLVTPADRDTLLRRLDQIQAALEAYRSLDRPGGKPTAWNLFAGQDDPSRANAYITLLVCQGLLDLHRADLRCASEWMRDELLDGSIAWLVKQFDGRGWGTPSTVADQFNDGFTLQVMSTLLAAEAAGVAQLPDALVEQIPHLLADCETRPLDQKSPVRFSRAPSETTRGNSAVRNPANAADLVRLGGQMRRGLAAAR